VEILTLIFQTRFPFSTVNYLSDNSSEQLFIVSKFELVYYSELFNWNIICFHQYTFYVLAKVKKRFDFRFRQSMLIWIRYLA